MSDSYHDDDHRPGAELAHVLLIDSPDDETMSDMFQWVASLTKNARSSAQTFGTYGNEVSAKGFEAGRFFLADSRLVSPLLASSTRICAWWCILGSLALDGTS
jgi:hypothetical protein